MPAPVVVGGHRNGVGEGANAGSPLFETVVKKYAAPGPNAAATTTARGWTDFAAQQQSSTTHTTTGETGGPSGGEKQPSPPPSQQGQAAMITVHNSTNYNIVNNITLKVGGREDEPDDRPAAQVPHAPQPHAPLVPKPPESARPASSTKGAPSSSSSASTSQTPRPNTAAAPSSGSQSPAGGQAPAQATAMSHYAVGKTIGEGTFGKVRKGVHKLTGLTVAIKILEKARIVDLSDVERVKREIHILTRVRHPNVIRLWEVIDSPRHIYLVMEYCSGGELFDYIVKQGRVKEEQACKFFHQILNGTDYFHNKNIIHRDLKPENLLLGNEGSELTLRVVDFGLGNVVKPGKLLKTACGSPCYASPEMISGLKYVGPGCDMWSLGVILFALLCGYLPFEDPNTARLYEKIMGGEYELPDFLSPDGRDLIQRLLNTDPKKRYNAEQVRRHAWYTRVQMPTDPAFSPAEAAMPVVSGPAASGKKVRMTVSGQSVDDETELDQEIIRHMVMLGYHPQQVTESITSNRHDHFAATYHLLGVKKQLANKTQQKGATPTATTQARPPTVPRIPTGSAAAGPNVPSAPVSATHHPQPPSTQRPSQGYAPRPHSQASTHPQPQAAFMQTAPTQPQAPSQPASSARVQSAGTVRPSPPSSAAAQQYSTTARPTTSHSGTKADAHHAWHDIAPGPGGLGVGNGVNGGAGVNAYMQHFAAQQQAVAAAALYASNASGAGSAYYRPPSSSPRGQQPQPPKQHAPPHSGRAATPSYQSATRQASGRGSRASARAAASGPVPTVPQAVYATNPLESVSYPVSSPLSHRGAVGPATGRPMTSRITGSTGGVSHRLYFPPSEKAAHDMAMAAAAGHARPTTGTGARPSSSLGLSISRPGTSAAGRRPPSGARNQPRGNQAASGAYGKAERERRDRERDRDLADVSLDEAEWTAVPSKSSVGGSSSPPHGSSSSFNAALSAMSFKPLTAILGELQRVLHGNGLQFTVLPPSGGSASPASPLAKHGFVPGALGALTSAGTSGLAPISISSLRPVARAGDADIPVAQSQVLEVRSGSNRFQFHVSPLGQAAAGFAKQLAADLEADGPSAVHSLNGAGHAVRVKRVLGDAASFKELCAKLLPQLKL